MKGYFFILCFLTTQVLAEDDDRYIKAYRSLNVDYSRYERRAISQKGDQKILRNTPLSTARLYRPDQIFKVISWHSEEEMQKRFVKIRDARFLTLNDDPDFPRRISWLYPKDGCFARAALFNRNVFRIFVPIPNKIFAFGNLRIKTENSPRGVVGWWYHVAPVVQVGETHYVLDPSIEPERPLPVEEWLGRMGNPSRIKVAICGSGTYSPNDRCNKESDGMELRAERTQKHYLALEERELERMGRNIEAELGENPPWISR